MAPPEGQLRKIPSETVCTMYRVGQRWVYSCEYAKQSYSRVIIYCISLHTPSCKPAWAPPWMKEPPLLLVCELYLFVTMSRGSFKLRM